MKPELILQTDAHAEQSLHRVEFELPVQHCLFTLSDSDSGAVTMTGEELDSLAMQWIAYRGADSPIAKTIRQMMGVARRWPKLTPHNRGMGVGAVAVLKRLQEILLKR